MTALTHHKPAQDTAAFIAACTFALSGSGSEIQLLPAGNFAGFDGRPAIVDGKQSGIPHWFVDESTAQELVALLNSRPNPYVIDYEHQTLKAEKNGQPAPAAGWFTKVEWRPGVGLFAIDVVWTPRASEMIDAGEYKFISPVLTYDTTGKVIGLLMAAITNFPAILGMNEILVAAATFQFAPLTATPTTEPKENELEELLEQLRWMLNLPLAATAEEVLAELEKLAKIIKGDADNTAAATGNLIGLIADLRSQVEALTNATPDPAKYVPIETMTALQGQIAALTANAGTKTLDAVITSAMAAGKLLPAQEAWARQLGTTNMAALTGFIDKAPAIAALSGLQTTTLPSPATAPGSGLTAALSADQESLCSAFGVSAEEFIATQNQLQQNAAGNI